MVRILRGHKLAKTVVLLLLVVLLASLSGLSLSACAGEKTAAREIVVGFLGDLTGPAAFAVKYVDYGLVDYLRMVDEEEPIAGLRMKVTTYDTRTDSGRIMPGYIWLKGQRATVMAVMGSVDREILADRFEQDKMPAIGAQGSVILQSSMWTYSLVASPEAQAEVILQWIADTWDYAGKGRNPSVGHVCWAGYTGSSYQRGIDGFLSAEPGRIALVAPKGAPYGSTTWAAETRQVMDCDYVICSAVGPGLASFTSEARQRGYMGRLVTGMEGYPGFWHLVTASTPPEHLNGCTYAVFAPSWDSPVPTIAKAKESIPKYHSPSEAEAILDEFATITGWMWGVWLTDAVRRAAAEVGAERIDGPAIRDALARTDMMVEGWGNRWKVTEDNNCLAWAQKLYEWSGTEGKWVPAKTGPSAVDGWYLPRSAPADIAIPG